VSDTELIVPVEVNALLVNVKVRDTHPFYRIKPSFIRMLGTDPMYEGRGAAEYDAFAGGKEVVGDESFEGVHVQWQLPEALTDGFVDETGETHYPSVPNRWLVVRYSRVRGVSKAAGWVVHSDYLYSDDDGASRDDRWEINDFLDLRGHEPVVDWLGRVHPLSDGLWHEPEPRPLFLTAIGAGLPTFPAYEPYHESIFSLHDDLKDLKEGSEGDSYPPDAVLSYMVAGWYSDRDSDSDTSEDILCQVARNDIPGLLPPGSDGCLADVIDALGWAIKPTAGTTLRGQGSNSPEAGPIECILDGRLDTWFQSGEAAKTGDTVTVDLGSTQQVSAAHIYLGQSDGQRIAPAKKLQYSPDNQQWTDLGTATGSDPELLWPLPGSAIEPPLTARYLRLRMTADSPDATVIRSFQITTVPDDAALVIPPLSPRFGTWSWAQPQATDTDALDWDERALIPADHLTHPDDPIPTARAGYLQLVPATDGPEPEPAPDPGPRRRSTRT